MPTTDWNWFFSSVAQSAAAIVGIFGAFIVTKILANQTAYAEKSRRIQELITLGEKLVDATNRLSFEWLPIPFRLSITVLDRFRALPTVAIFLPAFLEISLQEMDHAEVSMKFRIMRIELHGLIVVLEGQIDSARPGMEGTSISQCIEVLW